MGCNRLDRVLGFTAALVSAGAALLVASPVLAQETPTDSARFEALGCRLVDIHRTQLQLDGGAARQRDLVSRAQRLLLRSAPTRRHRVQAEALIGVADETYSGMWGQIWSEQRFIVFCTDSVSCKAVDISTPLTAFEAGSNRFVGILDDMVLILRRASGNARAGRHLIHEMRMTNRSNRIGVAGIPKSKSDCSGS